MKYGLVLDLTPLDQLEEDERRGVFLGLELGETWEQLRTWPNNTIRVAIAPQHMDGPLPEVFLRMGEAQNRAVRTEDSKVFEGFTDFVFGSAEPEAKGAEAHRLSFERGWSGLGLAEKMPLIEADPDWPRDDP